MGINSSIFADIADDEFEQEQLPSLMELDGQIRDSSRLRKQPQGDYSGKPVVSDIELPKRQQQSETDSVGQRPYEEKQ